MNVSELEIKDCSGCGLCVHVCPKNSITMVPDKIGYIRPVVDSKTCIDCGLCIKKCIIKQPQELGMPLATYAAVRQDRDKLMLSSSGGAFAAIAETVLSEGEWLVAGCVLNSEKEAEHILVDSLKDLPNLYGSKYVQSTMGDIYLKIKDSLNAGNKVLFSGTPCQVAAVKRFTRNHDHLYTIELICHGVANNQMFCSYLDMYKRREMKDFFFRDKKQGWTFNNRADYKSGKSAKINHRLSSYMTYFLQGDTYRDSCYQCPYAIDKRGADITIGDYWGVLKTRPDLNEKIDIERGVSCVLVNTEKGRQLVSQSPMNLYEVEYEAIKEGNGPLNEPSHCTRQREEVIRVWSKHCDWKDVHAYWKKHNYKISYYLWSMVPVSFQHRIRVLLGKR